MSLPVSTNDYITERLDELNRIASINVESDLGMGVKRAIDQGLYTGPQIQSMIVFEMLRLTSGMELATILIRGQLMHEIHERKLHSHFPENFSSAEEAIESRARLSRTQQSIIQNLYGIVFPYVEKRLSIDKETFWSSVERSNAAEILPYLRCLITGEPSKSERVNAGCDRILDEVDPEEFYTESDRRAMAVKRIVEDASILTNKQLRSSLAPEEVDSIHMVVLVDRERKYILAEVSDDQLDRLIKKGGDHLYPTFINTNDTPIGSVPLVKSLLRSGA